MRALLCAGHVDSFGFVVWAEGGDVAPATAAGTGAVLVISRKIREQTIPRATAMPAPILSRSTPLMKGMLSYRLALKRCKEYGRGVSSKASTCPNCGAPVKSKGISLRSGCLTILLVTGLLAWLGVKADNYARSPEGRASAAKREAQAEADRRTDETRREDVRRAEAQRANERADREAKLRQDATTFPALDVIAYYNANKVAGDGAFKNKVVKVKGVVDRVGKDILNKAYVVVKPTREYRGLRSVQCFFADAHVSELASIRPGRQLVIFGTCKGLMMNVLMEDCAIMEK